MDLPMCPSCDQSVLDDDATECPFCGASMTGKSGSTPAAPAATQKKAATKKKVAAKKSDGDDDDPFGVAASVTGKSVQLLAKPTKGRLHRIVCPMCETAGFQSKRAAGREVRCANKECLVPIFTAPRPEGEEAAEAPRAEEPQKSGSSIGMIGICAVAGLAIAGLAWYFTGDGSSTEQEPSELTGSTSQPGTTGTGGGTNGSETEKPVDNGTPVVVKPTGPTVEELWTKSLKQMVDDSRDRQNQRKELSRQLTAEAYAIRGDLTGLNEQLERIQVVASSQQHLGINPLVTYAWVRLAAGDAAGAGSVADRALKIAEKLPDFGADALDAAMELATLLVALDRSAEAQTLLAPRTNNNALGQLMEALIRAQATGTRNVDLAVKMRPVTRWADPQRVAVTVGLACRGESAKALAWAKAATDPQAARQCVSAWGEARIQSGETAALPEIEKELAGFSPANRAMVLSRLAIAFHAGGNVASAEATLAKAQSALKSAASPAKTSFPTLREIYELQPKDTSSMREASMAAAEIAHAQHMLGKEGVWESVTGALGFARAMAQSPVATQQALSQPKRSVTAMLKVEFNFQTDNEATNAYITYRSNCNRLIAGAAQRFETERAILRAACEWGLFDSVWEEIRERATKPQTAEREPWFDTELPAIVKTAFKVAGATDKEQSVEQAVTEKQLEDHPFKRMRFQLMAESLVEGNPDKAARGLDSFKASNEADSRWAAETKLRLATRLAASGQKDQALTFVASLKSDPVPRHAGFELVAGLITAGGDDKSILAYLKNEPGLKPEDRVALLRGFTGALKAKPEADPKDEAAVKTQ
jgi:hypothetical protein